MKKETKEVIGGVAALSVVAGGIVGYVGWDRAQDQERFDSLRRDDTTTPQPAASAAWAKDVAAVLEEARTSREVWPADVANAAFRAEQQLADPAKLPQDVTAEQVGEYRDAILEALAFRLADDPSLQAFTVDAHGQPAPLGALALAQEAVLTESTPWRVAEGVTPTGKPEWQLERIQDGLDKLAEATQAGPFGLAELAKGLGQVIDQRRGVEPQQGRGLGD